MLKLAAIYGALSGSITIAVMVAGMMFSGAHGNGAAGGAVFGYAVMLIALVMIFVGVKRYRDQSLGGVITFGPAFGLGLAIAFIAGVFYVIGWEINLAATDYAFAQNYANGLIAAKEKAGVAGAELEKLIADMGVFVEQYKNPLFRVPMTFIEIFPIGALVALASAALLRNPKMLPAR